MTSSNTLKKIVSIGAAMLLAVGGSLTSSAPASAAEVGSITLGGGSGLQPGMTSLSLGVGSCNSYSGTINLTDFQLTISGGSQTISSVSLFGYIVVNLSSALTAAQTISISYTKNVSRIITCGNGDTVGSFTYSGLVSGVAACNPAFTLTSVSRSETSLSPSTTVRSIYNNDPSIGSATNCTARFSNDAVGVLATLNGAVIGTPYQSPSFSLLISNASSTWSQITNSQNLTGQTIRDGDVYVVNYYVGIGQTPTLSDTPTLRTTLILCPSGGACSASGGNQQSPTAPVLSAEQARNVLKPVPAAVQPLVPAFLALNKPMASLGGKVALSAGDFTGLVSAQIAGKSLDFILGKTGQITMTVPQGEAGKTADLVLTFNTGSIILQDAIKYVAPVVVAEVPARPISVSSSSKSLSEEAQSEIRQAAFANVKNTAVSCVGYAAANTASARDAAVALATKACAIANKANSDLAITGINVVVDKLKARTQGVGIKVYKADN